MHLLKYINGIYLFSGISFLSFMLYYAYNPVDYEHDIQNYHVHFRGKRNQLIFLGLYLIDKKVGKAGLFAFLSVIALIFLILSIKWKEVKKNSPPMA